MVGRLAGVRELAEGQGCQASRGLRPPFPWHQLAEELEQELQSKQRLEGERRETESNWEAQIADILSWWVPCRVGPSGAEGQAMTLSPSQSG